MSVSFDGRSHPQDTAACVSLSNIHDVKQTDKLASAFRPGPPLEPLARPVPARSAVFIRLAPECQPRFSETCSDLFFPISSTPWCLEVEGSRSRFQVSSDARRRYLCAPLSDVNRLSQETCSDRRMMCRRTKNVCRRRIATAPFGQVSGSAEEARLYVFWVRAQPDFIKNAHESDCPFE